MVGDMLSSRSATTLKQKQPRIRQLVLLLADEKNGTEEYIWGSEIITCCKHMSIAKVSYGNILIDSDANFQVEVEAHGDKNLMNGGQYNYFTFSRSATGNLTASFTKCYSSKNWGLALTLRVTTSV